MQVQDVRWYGVQCVALLNALVSDAFTIHWKRSMACCVEACMVLQCTMYTPDGYAWLKHVHSYSCLPCAFSCHHPETR